MGISSPARRPVRCNLSEAISRRLPFVMMGATLPLGAYLLASFANDLARMSLRAYGTRAQSVLGGPVIWTAAHFLN